MVCVALEASESLGGSPPQLGSNASAMMLGYNTMGLRPGNCLFVCLFVRNLIAGIVPIGTTHPDAKYS